MSFCGCGKGSIVFTVAARHCNRKMRFIHLFVNLSSTKRT